MKILEIFVFYRDLLAVKSSSLYNVHKRDVESFIAWLTRVSEGRWC